MKIRSITISFILIGIFVGIILSLQIRARPPIAGMSIFDQIESHKELLDTFSEERIGLEKELENITSRLDEAKKTLEVRTSRQMVARRNQLREKTGLAEVKGAGIRITLNDNPGASRLDFSAANENFVQAADIRDLANALFLKDAQAVSINGRRVLAAGSIQSVFDSILIGDVSISPPFVIEAVGNIDELHEAVEHLNGRKLRVYADDVSYLEIGAYPTIPPTNLLSFQDS